MRAHHLAAEQVRLERPCRHRRCRWRRRSTTSSGSSRPAAKPGARASVHGRRVAAGHGDPGPAVQRLAAAAPARQRQLGQPVGPGAGVRRCRRSRSRPGVVEPEVGAAVDHEDLVGQLRRERPPRRRAAARGRRRRGRPASRGVVSSRTWSASGSRCGCTRPEARCRRCEAAVSAPIRTSGWPSSSRRISPPAYPLAPATAAVTMRMNIHTIQFLCRTGISPAGRPDPTGGAGGRGRRGRPRGRPAPAARRGCRRRPGHTGRTTRRARPSTAPSSRSVTCSGAVHSVRPTCSRMLSVISGAHDTGRQVERADAVLPAGLVQTAGQPGEGRLARAVRREVAALTECRHRWPG